MHSRLIREAGQGSKLTRCHLIAWQCVKVPPLDRATLHFRVGTSCWCGYGYASQILASIQRHFAFRATGPRALDEPLTVICRATTASGAAGTCPYESLGEDSCCSGDVGRLRSVGQRAKHPSGPEGEATHTARESHQEHLVSNIGPSRRSSGSSGTVQNC